MKNLSRTLKVKIKIMLNANYIVAILISFLAISCGAQNTDSSDSNESKESNQALVSIDLSAEPDTAYFAAGCFWCMEAIFHRVHGIRNAIVGYSGGQVDNPTYRLVSTGRTDYAESFMVIYDSNILSYRELVHLFFGAHDPTQLNRQGPDIGTQYRSIIFYTSPEQKAIALDVKRELNKTTFNGNIVTEITPFISFYEAEDYHQGYYETHPSSPYIKMVSKPKLMKFKKKFPEYLKKEYK